MLLRLYCLCLLVVISTPLAADEPTDLFNLGVGAYKQKRWDLAADYFQDYLTKFPQHAKAPLGRLYQGLTLVNLRKYDDARAVLRQFVKENPESRYRPDAMYRIGECSYLLNDLTTAEADFQTFLKVYPEHELAEWALPYLGDAQLRQKKLATATATFRQALEKFPQGRLSEDAQFGLARSLEEAGQTGPAIEVYEKVAARRTSPRAPQAQLKVGTLHFDGKNYRAAVRAYLDLQQAFPESEWIHTARLNAGYAYYQLGEHRSAIAQFQQAAQHKPQAVSARYWAGICHKLLGEFEPAAQLLQSAFEADPQGPLAANILHQWGDAEIHRGRSEVAQRLFVQLADGWPQGELADDALFFAAEAALAGGELEAAEQLSARLRRDYPRSSLRLHQQLLEGRLLEAKGTPADLKQAVGVFEDVLAESKISRTQSYARFHLARTWSKLGDDRKVLDTVTPLVEEVRKNDAAVEFADALVLAGTSALSLNDFERSIGDLTAYLKLLPKGPQADQALATLAVAEAKRGGKAESRQYLEQLQQQFPQSPLLSPTIHQLGEWYFSQEDWARAAELFDQLVQFGSDSPFHAKGLSGVAWSLYHQGELDEAAGLFERVVREHGADEELAPEAAYMFGQALEDAKKLPEAAQAYASALEAYAPAKPTPNAEQAGAGYYAYRAGLQAARVLRSMENRRQDADAAYAALLERFPKPDHLDKLLDEWALLNYEAGDYSRSDEIFRRLINEVPNSDLADNARLSLAESDLIAGQLDAAKQSLTELEASPASDTQVQQVALSHLIGIAVERKAWNEVDTLTERLHQKFPDSRFRRPADFYRAESLIQQGKIDDGQKLLLALKDNADNAEVSGSDWFPRVWVLLAETYYRQKNYAAVAETVEQFQTWKPDSKFLYQAYEVLGRSYKNQARFEEARTAFENAIKLPGAHRTETAAKSQLMIAETHLIQKNHQRALKEYLKVYHLYKFPEWQAPALYQAAQCDESLGNWQSAVTAYEDLLRDFPNSEFAEKAKARLPQARRKAG